MSEEDRRKRILIMKIGVSVLTVAILFFWIFNLKNNWRSEQQSTANQQNSLKSFTSNFNKAVQNIQGQLNKNKQIQNNLSTTSTSTLLTPIVPSKNSNATISSSTVSQIVSSSTLKNIPAQLVTKHSPPIISSSTSTSRGNIRCPQYINCMPTYGQAARSCQIPTGCENITQLVY